jgi:predicted metal-dependent hydrolase
LTSSVRFLGKPHQIVISRSPLQVSRVWRKDGVIHCQLWAGFPATHLEETIEVRLIEWLKAQAKLIIPGRVAVICEQFGLHTGPITIKDVRSRWGSCSVRGRLNFNWRLVMAPPEVIDYLVIHETAHLQEMNHSARFWAIVRERCPDYRSHQTWLKACGTELMSWGSG